MTRIALLWLAVCGAAGLAFAEAGFPLAVDYSARIGFGALNARSNPMMATDGAGALYILDTGDPSMLPATAVLGSPASPASYIMKLSPAGDRIEYLAVLGFRVGAMAVDPSGNAYVTGSGLIAKLNAAGTAFVAQLSFSNELELDGLAVDDAGRAYVVGHTLSGTLTTAPNAFQKTASANNRSNVFIARIDPSWNGFDYATYLAGTGWDIPTGIAVDSSGAAFVTGKTTSIDFPVTPGAYRGDRNKQTDIFVPFLTRLAPDGSRLIYSTFTGDANEEVKAMAVDPNGHAVVYRQNVHGPVLLRFHAQGTSVTFSKALPSSSLPTHPVRVLMDAAGNTYVTGFAGGANYPVKNSLIPCGSFYLTVLDPSGDLLQSSYLPAGTGIVFQPNALALAPNSTVYVVGPADSAFAPTREIGSATGSLALTRLSPSENARTVKLACVGNAASYDPGPVAPGEIVSLFGQGLGPPQGTQPTVDMARGFPTILENVQVTFDSIPAPLLYVQHGQINAIAPWSLTEGSTTEICVGFNGAKTNCMTRAVARASPGVFTADGRYAAAVNQDGTINSADNPAPWGSIVSIFGTGLGPISPPQASGAIVGLPLPLNVLPAKIGMISGGAIAQILVFEDPSYAGTAPFQVAGVSQINLAVTSNSMFLAVGPEFVDINSRAWSKSFLIHVR